MSQFEDYNSWRLVTNGGVRYRFLGSTGSFNQEGGEIEWKAIIRSQDLYEVLVELFPPPIMVGGVSYPNAGTMPGYPAMVAKKVSYDNHVEGLPTDPYGYDTTAPMGTYSEFIVITISFGPHVAKASNPADPRSFLEVSCQASGEFLFVPSTNTQIQNEESTTGTEDEEPGEGAIDGNTGLPTGDRTNPPGEEGEKRPVRNPVLPASMMVPALKWSVKWKQIPADHFRSVVIHRLRLMLGRVNSAPCGFLYDAPPETLLFLGFNHTESYSWRLGNLESPPIDVDLQILEKRVIHRGVICGHNHVFEPGNGWVRQWIGANWDESMYRSIDMNFLFQV